MNIEKIFSKGYQLFVQTFTTVAPAIVLYSLFNAGLSIALDYIFGTTNNMDDLLNSPLSSEEIPDINSMGILLNYFILSLCQMIYYVAFIQFIFSKIYKANLKFNLSASIKSAFKIIGIYILVTGAPLVISIILDDSGLLFMLGFFILYLITHFAPYFIINQNKNIIESMLLSYDLIKNNTFNYLLLRGMHLIITFIMLILFLQFYSLQIVFLLKPVMIGFGTYLMWIFDVYFYYSANNTNTLISDYIDE